MTASKKIIVIVAVVLLVAVIVFASIGAASVAKSKVQLVKLSDIEIPEHLDQDKLFGLFFFDKKGNLVPVKDGLDKVNYDPSKPTIIHIHGQQQYKGFSGFDPFDNPVGTVGEGYNYGVFLWSQLADVGFADSAKPKIWSRGSGSYVYADADGKRVAAEDVLQYATAEVFVAYYLDFIEKAGCNASSITFSGHSLGANTLYAVTSYITTLYKEGLVSKKYLPDRCVYLDAYLDALVCDDIYVPWLGHTIGEDGIVGLARDAVDAAREIGIATLYVKSSEFVTYLSDNSAFGGYKGISKTLHDKMVYVDYNTDYTGNPAEQHNASSYWIFNTIDRLVTDQATGDKEYVVNFKTPISYTYARKGARYFMNTNKTGDNFDDDVFYNTNIETAKIAGFVFNDENNNGVYDDRLYNRVKDVKVQLWQGDTLVGEYVTTEAGYYEFNLTKSDVGKKYTVKAVLPSGLTFAKESDGGYMNNGVSGEGSSAQITIGSNSDLKIINIGTIKK